MARWTLGACLAFSLSLCPAGGCNADSDERVSQPDHTRARRVVIAFLQRLQADHEIPDLGLRGEDLRVREFYERPRGLRPKRIMIDGPIEAGVELPEFTVTGISLYANDHFPVGEKLTEEALLRRARQLMERYVPRELAAQLGAPEIQRGEPYARCSEFWAINWERQVGGYGLPNDSCGVALLPDGQFRAIDWGCPSVPPPTLEVTVPRERAAELGRQGALRIMDRFRRRFHDHQLQELLGAELRIVNPNLCHAWESEDEGQFAHRVSREARLAWVVKFSSRDCRDDPDSFRNPDKELYVWIDAVTGDLLGGDFTF